MDRQRRDWLRGRFRVADSAVPLPWLRSPEQFTEQCTRCHECVRSCPEHIIVAGDGGFPTIEFRRGECTFCRLCADSCPELLFVTSTTDAPWTRVARIQGSCLSFAAVSCRSCEDACEATAIRFSPQPGGVSVPRIETDRCTGCGACVSRCPVQAIDVPDTSQQSPVVRAAGPEQHLDSRCGE